MLISTMCAHELSSGAYWCTATAASRPMAQNFRSRLPSPEFQRLLDLSTGKPRRGSPCYSPRNLSMADRICAELPAEQRPIELSTERPHRSLSTGSNWSSCSDLKDSMSDIGAESAKRILWLCELRWTSTHLEPWQRSQCPLCQVNCSDLGTMLKHLIDCKQSGKKFWCWDCLAWEEFPPQFPRTKKNAWKKLRLIKGLQKAIWSPVRCLNGRRAKSKELFGGFDSTKTDLSSPDRKPQEFVEERIMSPSESLSQHTAAVDSPLPHRGFDSSVQSALHRRRPWPQRRLFNDHIPHPIDTATAPNFDFGTEKQSSGWESVASTPFPCYQPSPFTNDDGSPGLKGGLWSPMNAGLPASYPQHPTLWQRAQDIPVSSNHNGGYSDISELDSQASTAVDRSPFQLGFTPGPLSSEPAEMEGQGQASQFGSHVAAVHPVPELPAQARNESVVNLLSRFWERFSKEFDKRSADPIRGMDRHAALEQGLSEMERMLHHHDYLGGRATVCFTRVVLAMSDSIQFDFPASMIEQLEGEGSKFNSMSFSSKPAGLFQAVACYFLDALQITEHHQLFDPCRPPPCSCPSPPYEYGQIGERLISAFPALGKDIRNAIKSSNDASPRHMELLLVNAPLSATSTGNLSSSAYFHQYIPRVKELLDSRYCCFKREHFQIASIKLMRELLLRPSTPQPMGPPSRQWSSDSTGTISSAGAESMGSFTDAPICSPPESMSSVDDEFTAPEERTLECPMCKFSTRAKQHDNRCKSLRRHLLDSHLPIEEVLICGLCGTECRRKGSLEDHCKNKHKGKIKMRRELRVREEFEQDPMRFFPLEERYELS